MDLNKLDLKKLRTFHLVVSSGTLGRAASQLGVTLAAVSFSIRRLEKELGVRLFERLPNKLILTRAGAHVADSARAIFEGIEKVWADSSIRVAPSGRFAISVNADLAWYFIPKVGEFLARYSDVDLSVHVNTSTATVGLVKGGEIDVGFGQFSKHPASLEVAPVFQTSISLVCMAGHPLTRSKMPSFEEISRYKLITLRSRNGSRQMLDAEFARAGLKATYIEGGNCYTVGAIAAAGLGVGLIHTLCTRQQIPSSLRYIDLSPRLGDLRVSAIYPRKGRIDPTVVRNLIDFVGQDAQRQIQLSRHTRQRHLGHSVARKNTE
jgi:DNA-binding transcriptional LysR family regulator